MIEITAETTMKRHPDAAFRVVEDSALIVLLRESKLITLNEVGTRVWQLLEGQNVAQIAAILSREFDVSEDQALTDTVSFVSTMRDRGMITLEER